ncbi:MAG: exonuclease domain-containing protein [Candidatus Margulisiibacteriota bacterium]|jgi:DNA polymerase III epsilon subunit family exonuclease
METLNQKCPKCKKESLIIKSNKIFCPNKSCEYEIAYLCPICDHDLANIKEDQIGAYFLCKNCNNKIHLKRIKYLIDNSLYVDKEQKCPYCNGPTIHRKEINLAHRCLFFPSCSGQASLFSVKKEALTFFDFETTGLDIGKDSIIEIGAIKIDEEGFEHTFQTLIKPREGTLNERISNFTGITKDMVQAAPDLKTSLINFLAFAKESTLVAHNANFDFLWLLTSTLRHNLELKSKNVICTLKWAEKSQENNKSLNALAKKYNIAHKNAHRALADAVTTKELFFIFENLNKEPRPIIDAETYFAQSKKIIERYQDYVQH